MSDIKYNQKYYEKTKAKIKKSSDEEKTSPTLLEVSDISDFKDDEEIVALLKAYYDDDSIFRIIGTIINSVFTHGYNVFVITADWADKLVALDKNYDTPNSIGGQVYKRVMAKLYADKIIVCLRKPVKSVNGQPGKSGLYEIVDEDILYLLGRSIGMATLQANKDRWTEWFDEKNPDYIEEKPLSPEEKAMWEKAKANAAAKRGNK